MVFDNNKNKIKIKIKIKIWGFRLSPYQNTGAAWNQSLMLNAMVQASEVKVLSMGYVAPIVARHKISKLCRAADLYINVHFLSFVFLLLYIVCVSFYVYGISFADRCHSCRTLK